MGNPANTQVSGPPSKSGTALVVGSCEDSAFLLGLALVELLVAEQMLTRAASAMSFRKGKI